MGLPVQFTESMKELLGGSYDDFIASYEKEPVSSIRINTAKITAGEFDGIAPFPIEPVPFVPNGYYINGTDAWSKHPYYFAGLYYIQEASAMLPAHLLPVEEGDVVCDLCAAPGGKSTQLAAKAGLLISNDISRSRTIALTKNLELCGCDNHFITCEEPSRLSSIYRGCIDKVLVDAPCSGEGMFRKDAGLISSYIKKGPDSYCDTQRHILEAAYDMVRPGGMIMYSTCTFSDIEDENVISLFLEDHPDMKIVDLTSVYEGFAGPYEKYRGFGALKGCVHVFPHMVRGEGHFIALMEKAGDLQRPERSAKDTTTGYNDLPADVREFMMLCSDRLSDKICKRRFLINNDGLITMLPEGFEGYYNRNIHYARTGTCIGTAGRNGRFVPHTAFTLSMKSRDFSNTVNLDADDENVYRYLKGETISGAKRCADKGYVLICVDGYPLGFAKYDGVRFKNLYEKGWRLM